MVLSFSWLQQNSQGKQLHEEKRLILLTPLEIQGQDWVAHQAGLAESVQREGRPYSHQEAERSVGLNSHFANSHFW